VTTPSELALLGGVPHFTEPLHIGRPNVGDKDRFFQRLETILESKWLSNDGPMVREFEEAIASLSYAKYCIAVCNGTIGLQIAARALSLEGDIVVPSFTFIATAHSLRWQGLAPVFADIEGPYHSIGPSSVRRAITEETTAVVAVRTWGLPTADLDLESLARKKHLRLIFDSAHALGCGWKDGSRGLRGDAEVLSFHATKFLNTFEGGAILTDDPELAERARLMRNFGFSGFDKVDMIGTNGKMSEPCAAMGLTNLESLAAITERNRENHAAYSSALAELPGISLLSAPDNYEWNHQYVVGLVDETCPLDRDVLVQVLLAENVLARRYFFPGIHRMEPYVSDGYDYRERLPATERAASQVLLLPTGTAVQPTDACAVGRLLGLAIDMAGPVSKALETAPKLTGAVPGAATGPKAGYVPRD
jgi:dTDP-4-amino-4,6-dideoxygalactose transaminase